MAKDNPSWGYRRIQGVLKNLGQVVVHNTVKRILQNHGIEPAPERGKKTTWSQFLRSHWSTPAASDFFFAEGHSSKCFAFVRDWVEKKIQRHLQSSRQRQGFGWKRWSREWLYETLGLLGDYRVKYFRLQTKSNPA